MSQALREAIHHLSDSDTLTVGTIRRLLGGPEQEEGARSAPRSPEDNIARANRRADMHAQGVKGLLVVNGGGILALLTFATQLLVQDQQLAPLVKMIIIAIALLGLGLIVALPMNHFRYEASRRFDSEETKRRGQRYALAHRILFWMSLALFFVGITIALVGMWNLGPP